LKTGLDITLFSTGNFDPSLFECNNIFMIIFHTKADYLPKYTTAAIQAQRQAAQAAYLGRTEGSVVDIPLDLGSLQHSSCSRTSPLYIIAVLIAIITSKIDPS
jgi:hypothetical protein